MKNLKQNTRIFLSMVMMLTCLNFVTQAQDRGSVWVHGWNSNRKDWSAWESLFTNERKLINSAQGRTPNSYTTSNGVPTMATEVLNSINRVDQRVIYFGHSMGGVVGREIDIKNPGRIQGIVTFGAPLDGAKIANSFANGQADAFINEGARLVARGPSRQAIGIPIIGPLIYVAWNATADIIIKDVILSPLHSLFPINRGATDISESSSYLLSGVRDNATATPKIHVYGNENSPVLWRLAGSVIQIKDHKPAYNDAQIVEGISTAADIWEAAMWINFGLAAATGWWTFGVGAVYYSFVADGWMDGKNWLRYDSESGWNNLIGASTGSYREVSYINFNGNQFSECMNRGFNSGTNIQVVYNRCSQEATSTSYYTYYSPVNGQSDGFIKAPSQTGYNSKWSDNATTIEALGVNHLEMLDNPKMKIIMNGIFDGAKGDPFFKTDLRK